MNIAKKAAVAITVAGITAAAAVKSPDVVPGTLVQAPVHVPVHVVGGAND